MSVVYKTLEQLLNTTDLVKDFLVNASDCREKINEAFESGESSGEKCFIPKLDDQFSWRKGYVYCCSGYPGSGKSEFVNWLAVLQAKNKGVKIGMYSPENYPIYNLAISLMKAYVGKNISKGFNNQCTNEEFLEAFEFVNNHFYFLRFEDVPKLSQLLTKYQILADEKGCEMFITDPFNAIAEGAIGNMSQHLMTALTQMKMFAENKNVYNVIIEHPVKPQPNKDGSLPECSPWMLYGGSMWWNKMDCIFTLGRNLFDNSPAVNVRTWKMKLQRLNGKPGEQHLYFDIASGRYYEEPINYVPKIGNNGASF